MLVICENCKNEFVLTKELITSAVWSHNENIEYEIHCPYCGYSEIIRRIQ